MSSDHESLWLPRYFEVPSLRRYFYSFPQTPHPRAEAAPLGPFAMASLLDYNWQQLRILNLHLSKLSNLGWSWFSLDLSYIIGHNRTLYDRAVCNRLIYDRALHNRTLWGTIGDNNWTRLISHCQLLVSVELCNGTNLLPPNVRS